LVSLVLYGKRKDSGAEIGGNKISLFQFRINYKIWNVLSTL